LALITLVSTAEGTSAAGGNISTVNSSTELPFHRAAASRSGANSMARCGCGMAPSQCESRRTSPLARVSGRIVEMLLNEGHLVNFFQGCDAIANLCQAALAQGDHAFFSSDALDLRSGPAVHNHLADTIGQVEQLADCRSAMESGTRAFQAPAAFHQSNRRPNRRI